MANYLNELTAVSRYLCPALGRQDTEGLPAEYIWFLHVEAFTLPALLLASKELLASDFEHLGGFEGTSEYYKTTLGGLRVKLGQTKLFYHFKIFVTDAKFHNDRTLLGSLQAPDALLTQLRKTHEWYMGLEPEAHSESYRTLAENLAVLSLLIAHASGNLPQLKNKLYEDGCDAAQDIRYLTRAVHVLAALKPELNKQLVVA
jgi:hypothetical protein